MYCSCFFWFGLVLNWCDWFWIVGWFESGKTRHMMLCSALTSQIHSWLRDYDRIQYLAVVLIYIQVHKQHSRPSLPSSFRLNLFVHTPPQFRYLVIGCDLWCYLRFLCHIYVIHVHVCFRHCFFLSWIRVSWSIQIQHKSILASWKRE